jgi:hypothetical protein
MDTDTRFISDGYALIVGPASLTEPIDSQDVQDIADYPVAEVLASLLAVPGVRQIGEAGPRWAGWAAAWECGDRLVLFEVVEELGDGDRFGSVHLRCDCHVGDVLGVWEALRTRHPGLWLIDPDSRLQTPASFAAGYTFDHSWRTPDVLALARGVRGEGAYDRLPILADALQEAGCDNAYILDHCRGPGPHVRGCFVVDLVLGKS